MDLGTTPQATVAYHVYDEAKRFLGIVTAELPKVSYAQVDLSGAGLAGKTSVPILGQVEKMDLKLAFQTASPETASLQEHRAHHIELCAAVQFQDSASGKFGTYQHKFIMRATPAEIDPGKFEKSAAQDFSLSFVVTYLKEIIDGRVVKEIDQLNSKCVINGIDYLASVRKDTGLV